MIWLYLEYSRQVVENPCCFCFCTFDNHEIAISKTCSKHSIHNNNITLRKMDHRVCNQQPLINVNGSYRNPIAIYF